MIERLEHEHFANRLNQNFRIRLNDQKIDAVLCEVSEFLVSPRQERFAIVFRTSNETLLPQGQTAFEHDEMGEFELFLVPIGRDEQGSYYEAVFNRLAKRTVPQE